jgi:hypothetical protein
MRHTHATHGLERGVELTTVRDHLRHSSVSTTSGRRVTAQRQGKAPKYLDAQAWLREFAKAVQNLARNDRLTRQVLRAKLCEIADATLAQAKVSMAALARAWLVEHPNQARAILAKLVELPLQSNGEHPVTAALDVLRGLYAGSSRELPPVAHIDLGRRWREAIRTRVAIQCPQTFALLVSKYETASGILPFRLAIIRSARLVMSRLLSEFGSPCRPI